MVNEIKKKLAPGRKKWWKAALCFFAGWLLAFYILSNALHFIFGPWETPDGEGPAVIEEPLKITPPPGYNQKERE